MTLSLNHYSIRTADLDACRRFYVDVLGLEVGPRPNFSFPGLWLYAGDTSQWSNAVVHIIGIDAGKPEGLKDYLGDREAGAAAAAPSTTWPSSPPAWWPCAPSSGAWASWLANEPYPTWPAPALRR
jgi:catechol 2,3-dioxygenase-like lactoylglutathione lyase family enzyme